MMDIRADDVRVACPLFHEEGSGSTPTSALQLRFGTLDIDTAIALNRLWHSRLPKVIRSNITRCPMKVCFGAEFDGIYFAIAIWTNPVARLLSQNTWFELRRFSIAPDAPKNTASRMLGWMVREIRKTFPGIEKLISYQDLDVHKGTIYKASGWKPTAIRKKGEWSCPSRYRKKVEAFAAKQRWELSLKHEDAQKDDDH